MASCSAVTMKQRVCDRVVHAKKRDSQSTRIDWTTRKALLLIGVMSQVSWTQGLE